MFAAAAAAPFFDEVVVLERDHEPPLREPADVYADASEYLQDGRARRGVPQFLQLHIVLRKGWLVGEEFMPGLLQAMHDAGAVPFNAFQDIKEVIPALGLEVFNPDCTGEFMGFVNTRALMERVIRRQLLATHSNVRFQWSSAATGLRYGTGDAAGIVTGVDVKGGRSERADLVVDASGPRSGLREWLAEGGYAEPRCVKVDPHVAYTFSTMDVPHEVADTIPWKVCYIRPVAPESRGGLIFRVERGRYQACAIGYADDPPLDFAGFAAFMHSLGQADCSQIVQSGKPLLTLGYRGASDTRWFYEETQLPGNLVVVGDAVARFNPAYGQGCTVAALHAEALRNMLQERAAAAGVAKLGPAELTAISSPLQTRIGKLVDFPFSLVTAEDLKYETTDGERSPPTLASKVMGAYLKQLVMAMGDDEHLKLGYMNVFHMIEGPSALLAPGLVARVMGRWLRSKLGFAGKATPPAGSDSASEPVTAAGS